MTQTTRPRQTTPPQSYLYVPPAYASGQPRRYFYACNYKNVDKGMLDVVRASLVAYTPIKAGEAGAELPALPKHPTNEQRAKTKGDILKMLERLTDTAPVAGHTREKMRAAWVKLMAGHEKAAATKDFDDMRQVMREACAELVPETIKANPHTMAGLRDKDISDQLLHMREVYDAIADESHRGDRQITPATMPKLVALERAMHMVLCMAQLDQDVGIALKMFDMDDNKLFIDGRDDRLRDATQGAIYKFERYMDATHTNWRKKPLVIPEDWSKKGEAPTIALGDVLDTMHNATTGGELKPYAELLSYVVAKQAYYFNSHLARAYDQDYARMVEEMHKRNRKRDIDAPSGEDHFKTHHETISAAYNAKWAALAKDAMRLMQRFEHTLEDPAIIPVESTEPKKRVDADSAMLFNKAALPLMKRGGRGGNT